MRRLRRAAVLLVTLGVTSLIFAAPAAAQLTRGIVSGTITDNTGALLPGATVTVVNNETGIVRTTVTNEAGFYRVPALEPGTYSVRVELSGFRTVENRQIPVQTAQEAVFNASLELATVAETVDVTADTTAITLNRTNATVGLTASSRQAVELPLSAARNVNNLALLSPNVFRAPGSTEISANGQRARNNNFTIDGSDNNDISVTLPTTPVVPEGVAEFQIQTNPFNVEFGRNSGAQINIITKSGSNVFRGQVWEYYRGSELNARDNLEKQTGRSEPARFNRNQFGAGIGGPILRNRTFFYGLFQGDKERTGGEPGPTIRIPTPRGFAALAGVPLGPNQTAASRQAVLERIAFLQDIHAQGVTFRNIQNTTVNGVPIETGQVNVSISQPFDAWNYIARIDHQLTVSDNLTGRYISNKPVTENLTSNTDFGSLFSANQEVWDQNLAISHTRIFSPSVLNEMRFSYIRRDLQFPEKDPESPTATIGGFFRIGGLSNFPQGRVQNSYQLSDVLTMQRGRHSLKFGADIRYIELDNQAAFDSKGTFNFNNLQDYVNNLAVTFRQALQTSSFLATQWQSFLFAQDDVKVTPNLTVNLGLRYEISTVPLGFFGAEEQFVRDALVPGPVQQDTDNWAPRLGFAWTPTPQSGFLRTLFGDSTSVVRGGYGIGYDILFYNILTVNGSNYPRVVVPEIPNAQNVYPNLLPVSGEARFDPLATFVNTPEDAQNPKTHFYSLSIQRELFRNYVVEIGYNGSLSRNGVNQLQANYAVLTPEQAETVARTQSTTSIPSVQQRRLFPQFGSRVLIATTAKANYNAGYIAVNRRMSNGLQFGLSYTFSKLMSDNDESLAVADIATGSPQIPQDFANVDAEWSPSAFDRTHRLAINYIYEVPWFSGSWAQNGLLKAVFSGWQLSGVTQYQSGQPFSILTGVDSNGNGAGGDRPNFNPAGTITPDPDTGNFRTFTTSNMFLVPRGSNGLPLAFGLGNGNLGKNTLRAAGFWNWDISLAKRFEIFGGHALRIRADFLNAFNQDNYGIPVNSLNNLSFGQNTRDWGNRSITLGASYIF